MKSWNLLVGLGVSSIVVGVLALFNPFSASLAVEQLAAWAFMILGFVQIFAAFRTEDWGGKLWTLFLGVVAVVIGVNLFGNPLSGLITLTLLMGVMFIVSGVFKILIALKVDQAQFKTAVFLSAAASLLIGGIIMGNFPQSAQVSLGILLGVELIANGICAAALGLFGKAAGNLIKA